MNNRSELEILEKNLQEEKTIVLDLMKRSPETMYDAVVYWTQRLSGNAVEDTTQPRYFKIIDAIANQLSLRDIDGTMAAMPGVFEDQKDRITDSHIKMAERITSHIRDQVEEALHRETIRTSSI